MVIYASCKEHIEAFEGAELGYRGISKDLYTKVFNDVYIDRNYDDHNKSDILIDDGSDEPIECNTGISKYEDWEILNNYAGQYSATTQLESSGEKVICTLGCHISAECKILHVQSYIYDKGMVTFEAPENIEKIFVSNLNMFNDLSKLTGCKTMVADLNVSQSDITVIAPAVTELDLRLQNIEHKLTLDMKKLSNIYISWIGDYDMIPIKIKSRKKRVDIIDSVNGFRNGRW